MHLKWLFTLCLSVAYMNFSMAQQTIVRAKIVERSTNEVISNVAVFIKNSSLIRATDENGEFLFNEKHIPLGEGVLVLSKAGYETQNLPIVINEGKELDLGLIYLHLSMNVYTSQIGIISLSDEELDQDIGSASNISGLLRASKDAFLQAAAFDFSASFFNPRGYDSEYGKVLINGIQMNKLYSGRPLWSNWGGLNDAMREQVFSMGMSANDYNFGGLAGSTNIIMRASQYYKGGGISYASANASYVGRVMISYNTGLMPNGWAVSILASRRFAQEGYNDGSLYDANSFFAAFEKKFNEKHSLNLVGFFTPNRRGKSSANTQEVYDLKDTKYNAYWGNQDTQKRNSRIRKVEEPMAMLNHYWDFSETTNLNTNIAYQFGKRSDSRLGFNNAPNPDPAYYQKLPSYFLGDPSGPNYDLADLAKKEFQEDGQVDWLRMYQTNIAYGGTSRYYLYEDRVDDKQISANINFSKHMDNVTLNAAINYRNLSSHNFASMLDLLGGDGFLDVDTYNFGDAAQSDLNNPDRIVSHSDIFKYNYKLFAEQYDAFFQAQFKYRKLDFYLAAEVGITNYQREGLFKNGAFAANSYGKSEKIDFSTYGLKAGFTYKITGRHLIDFNAAYYTKAPNSQNAFSNSRQNNEIVRGVTEENIRNIDLSYIYRSPLLKGRLTSFYTKINDATQISFFYADGISGLGRNTTTAFVQEVITGLDKQHLGIEFGLEAQVTPTIKLKTVAGMGQYTYVNNPSMYLTSDDFDQELDFGKSYLKNYKLSGGPQQAYQLGLEYHDPKYWWIGVTANLFSNAYVNVAPITRTKNFYMDSSGYPFVEYNEDIARELLKQERLSSYTLVNLVGGKSWRKGTYFIGLFASINNILNKEYITGGFEQGRKANYRTLKEDVDKEERVFGHKYWYGNGTTYYLNLNLRF